MARKKKPQPGPMSSKNNWGKPADFDWTLNGNDGGYYTYSRDIKNPATTSSGGGSGGTTVSSYGIVGDPSNPNNVQVSTAKNWNENWPQWAIAAVQGQSQPQGQADSTLASPLPTGKSLSTLMAEQKASPELVSRMNTAQARLADPQQFVNENIAELNQEQTILDKGLSFVGGLFNYEDESDLQVFGMNISAVESVWDTGMRYLTGGRNALDAGIGALISAMPGGLPTLEWGQLTDNHSLWEVIHGDIGMQPNVAPSPMQIAITSAGIEAKRIREGGARLSDVLLLNPAIAPFLLAGIAAEDSPVQRDGFNILDPKQREEAFGSGWEKFFSGVGDFGVQMAAPGAGAVMATKAILKGALGISKGGRTVAQAMDKATPEAMDELLTSLIDDAGNAPSWGAIETKHFDARTRVAALAEKRIKMKDHAQKYNVPEEPSVADPFWTEMDQRGFLQGMDVDTAKARYAEGKKLDDVLAAETPDELSSVAFARNMDDVFGFWQSRAVARAAGEVGDDIQPLLDDTIRLTRSSDEIEKATGKKLSPLARFYNDVLQVDESGNKVMSAAKIEQRIEFRRNPMRAAIAELLHDIHDPYVLGLTMNALHGSNDARRSLEAIRPAISDELWSLNASIVRDRALLDPSKASAVKKMFESSREALVRQREMLFDRSTAYRTIGEVPGPDGKPIPVRNHEVITDPAALEQAATLDKSIDQLDMLIRYVDGEDIDLMAPGAFYNADHAQRVVLDVYKHSKTIDHALSDDMYNAMLAGNPEHRPIIRAGTWVQRQLPHESEWYARQIAKRRERAAAARYEYITDGGARVIPRRVLKTMRTVDENGAEIAPRAVREWDFGWVAGRSVAYNLRRKTRAWMWLGLETPSGFIGLKGASRLGSEREIDAVTDLDLYTNPAVIVTYKNADGTVHAPEAVGGPERRAQLKSIWAKALLDPHADLKSTLVLIERMMEDDMAKAYGLRGMGKNGVEDAFSAAMKKADRIRADVQQQAARTGTFIDPLTREVHQVPYLKHQLANGMYMHNWHALERALQRNALKMYGPRAGSASRSFERGAQTGIDVAVKIDNLFQEFWRPLVLFRLSYTQRNVMEGMIRSMAYYGSLAPLLWPVEGTALGIANMTANRVARRSAAKVSKRIADNPKFRDLRRQFNDEMDEHIALQASYPWVPDATEWERMKTTGELRFHPDADMPDHPVRVLYRRDTNGERYADFIQPDKFDDLLVASHERLIAARKALEPVEAELDAAAKGTKFGKWRHKNILEQRKRICEAETALRMMSQLAVAGGVPLTTHMAAVADHFAARAVAQDALDTLRFDPAGAIALYRGQAARGKRIGSGTSRGPLGGTYSNAFNDEFELMDRQALSSDLSRMTTLHAQSDVMGSIMRDLYVRQDVGIAYSEGSRGDWARGMAQTIERQSWNPLVQILLMNNMNPEAAIEWMLRTRQGREFANYQRWLEGTDFDADDLTRYVPVEGRPLGGTLGGRAFEDVQRYIGPDPEHAADAPATQWETVSTRLRKTADRLTDPITGRYEIVDHVHSVSNYVYTVANIIREQMQFNPEFLAVAKRRAIGVKQGIPTPVSQADIEDILRAMPMEERSKLGAVSGSIEIDAGTRDLMGIWRKTVEKMFHVIGTIPEDSLVRGPFYAKRFKQVRNTLIENYLRYEDPAAAAALKRGWRSKAGSVDADGIEHPPFKISTDELDRIYRTAHRQALSDTREYLYTIERRTNLGKYGEHIWPFISAQQNTFTAGGKILYKNPWVGVLAAKLWAQPELLGWKDENGNTVLPMPIEWLDDRLKDAVDVPVIGGILSGSSVLVMPQNGLNVFAPDSGFLGVVPRPGGMVPMLASNLMQVGAFPVDTPDAFRAMFGDNADSAYQAVKDYMFGDQGSMSDKPGSWDKVLPPYWQRILDSRNELSSAYGYQFRLEWSDQIARALKGERDDWPTPEEVNKRVTNKFWFYAFGNFGTFGPTRPDIQKPLVTELQGILQMYLNAQGVKGKDGAYLVEPGKAYQAFSRDFGEDLLPIALKGSSKSVGGADQTIHTIGDIRAYDGVIRQVAPGLGNDLDILDILVNNSNETAADYSDEAGRYERIAAIPGVSDTWRRQMTGEEIAADSQKIDGWAKYRQFMDGIDAQMYSMGLRNLQQSAAAPLRMKKDIFIANMSQSNRAWYLDYTDGTAARTPKVINLLTTMVNDPTVNSRMLANDQDGLLAAIHDYVYYRQQFVMAVEQSGKPASDAANLPLRESWDTIRQRLKESNVRWADIANRWLPNDDTPTFAGEPIVPTPATPIPIGAAS